MCDWLYMEYDKYIIDKNLEKIIKIAEDNFLAEEKRKYLKYKYKYFKLIKKSNKLF